MTMQSLYMFAIVPPTDLGERIQKERIIFSENYKCVKALKPPVHITIYEPFQQEDEFETAVRGLQSWAGKQEPFTIDIENYGFFEHSKSPVAYINVIKSPEITLLRTGLLLELKKYMEEPDTQYLPNNKPIPKPKPQPFNPHFTIGYRDVPPELLPEIKQAYARRQFKGSFTCNALYLWKHNGQNWQTVIEFPMNGKPLISAQASLF